MGKGQAETTMTTDALDGIPLYVEFAEETQSALEKVSDATGDLLILMGVIAGMTILYFYVIVGKGVYDNHNPDPNKISEKETMERVQSALREIRTMRRDLASLKN